MLYGRQDQEQTKTIIPTFARIEEMHDLPKYKLNHETIPASVAEQMINDELESEGNARQNLATFCQTYMEPEAEILMARAMAKNAIDKSEYPRTTELENRCVNIIADLWHASENYLGTSTVGSSEACMLAGLALKVRFENYAKAKGLDLTKHKPNIIISAGYQVCWEKFCTYWDVELREVPLSEGHLSLDIDRLPQYIDEYTIGIVGIMGITYTGQYDDIAALDNFVEEYNQTADFKLAIHVDAASGGFFAPFIEEKIIWDFRLHNVVSINASGHKYGLVYPSIGWVIWRDKKWVPEKFIFEVNYLGGTLPTMSINFSRSAQSIIGQYYNFIRYGFEGYYHIHKRTQKVASYIITELEKTGLFEVVNGAEHLPVLCYKLKEDSKRKWNLYDLSDRMRMTGWQIPTYTLPTGLEDVVVQRIVCRADLGMNVAIELIEDFKQAILDLENAKVLVNTATSHPDNYGFTH